MHGNEDFDELAKLLGETVKSRITPEIATNQFRTCRIPL